MPITSKPASTPATEAGEGAPPAPLLAADDYGLDGPQPDNCINCEEPVQTCACHPFCAAPFMGLVHIRGGSHLCGWPILVKSAPGSEWPTVATTERNIPDAD